MTQFLRFHRPPASNENTFFYDMSHLHWFTTYNAWFQVLHQSIKGRTGKKSEMLEYDLKLFFFFNSS